MWIPLAMKAGRKCCMWYFKLFWCCSYIRLFLSFQMRYSTFDLLFNWHSCGGMKKNQECRKKWPPLGGDRHVIGYVSYLERKFRLDPLRIECFERLFRHILTVLLIINSVKYISILKQVAQGSQDRPGLSGSMGHPHSHGSSGQLMKSPEPRVVQSCS